MSAASRKINLGWFGKTQTAEVQKSKPCFLRTADATVTPLLVVELADATAGLLEATVAARAENGTDRAAYKVLARVSREGGGAVVVATDVIAPSESAGAATWACTWVANGNNVELRVTGQAARFIQWQGRVTAEILGG